MLSIIYPRILNVYLWDLKGLKKSFVYFFLNVHHVIFQALWVWLMLRNLLLMTTREKRLPPQCLCEEAGASDTSGVRFPWRWGWGGGLVFWLVKTSQLRTCSFTFLEWVQYLVSNPLSDANKGRTFSVVRTPWTYKHNLVSCVRKK